MPLRQLGAQTQNTTVGIREYGQDVNLRMTSQRSARRAATCAASETLPLTGMVTRTGGVITEESSLENETVGRRDIRDFHFK